MAHFVSGPSVFIENIISIILYFCAVIKKVASKYSLPPFPGKKFIIQLNIGALGCVINLLVYVDMFMLQFLSSVHGKSPLYHIQCSAVMMQSVLSKILTMDTP